MGRFFDGKTCIMDWYTFEHLQHTSQQWQGRKSGILLQIEKAPEASGDLMCYVFSLEDAVAHLSVTNSCGILTVEK